MANINITTKDGKSITIQAEDGRDQSYYDKVVTDVVADYEKNKNDLQPVTPPPPAPPQEKRNSLSSVKDIGRSILNRTSKIANTAFGDTNNQTEADRSFNKIDPTLRGILRGVGTAGQAVIGAGETAFNLAKAPAVFLDDITGGAGRRALERIANSQPVQEAVDIAKETATDLGARAVGAVRRGSSLLKRDTRTQEEINRDNEINREAFLGGVEDIAKSDVVGNIIEGTAGILGAKGIAKGSGASLKASGKAFVKSGEAIDKLSNISTNPNSKQGVISKATAKTLKGIGKAEEVVGEKISNPSSILPKFNKNKNKNNEKLSDQISKNVDEYLQTKSPAINTKIVQASDSDGINYHKVIASLANDFETAESGRLVTRAAEEKLTDRINRFDTNQKEARSKINGALASNPNQKISVDDLIKRARNNLILGVRDSEGNNRNVKDLPDANEADAILNIYKNNLLNIVKEKEKDFPNYTIDNNIKVERGLQGEITDVKNIDFETFEELRKQILNSKQANFPRARKVLGKILSDVQTQIVNDLDLPDNIKRDYLNNVKAEARAIQARDIVQELSGKSATGGDGSVRDLASFLGALRRASSGKVFSAAATALPRFDKYRSQNLIRRGSTIKRNTFGDDAQNLDTELDTELERDLDIITTNSIKKNSNTGQSPVRDTTPKTQESPQDSPKSAPVAPKKSIVKKEPKRTIKSERERVIALGASPDVLDKLSKSRGSKDTLRALSEIKDKSQLADSSFYLKNKDTGKVEIVSLAGKKIGDYDPKKLLKKEDVVKNNIKKIAKKSNQDVNLAKKKEKKAVTKKDKVIAKKVVQKKEEKVIRKNIDRDDEYIDLIKSGSTFKNVSIIMKNGNPDLDGDGLAKLQKEFQKKINYKVQKDLRSGDVLSESFELKGKKYTNIYQGRGELFRQDVEDVKK